MSQRARTRVGRLAASCVAGLAIGMIAGCGGGDATDEGAAKSAGAKSSQVAKSIGQPGQQELPTASIAGKTATNHQRVKSQPPKKGTPQWFVHQMLLKRFQKYPENATVEDLRKLRRQRNLDIVKLAKEAIPMTAKDPKLEEVFNAVIHQLVESSMALAMQGDEKDIESFYILADHLYQRDKKSKAAAEAAYKVAVFANQNALKFPDPKAGWLDEFTKQARLFATKFPQEQARAVRLLDAAGRSCEHHNRIADAISSYEQLRQQFPEMAQAKRATAVLRRLNLRGKKLMFGGPTIEGGYINVEDYRNKVVLVAFWSTGQTAFAKMVPELTKLQKTYSQKDFEIIGINLDKEEPAVDAFLEKTGASWPNIFHTDRAKRGWEHPVAKYYAIRRLPTLWLIGTDGKVITLNADPKTLSQQIRTLLARRTASRQ